MYVIVPHCQSNSMNRIPFEAENYKIVLQIMRRLYEVYMPMVACDLITPRKMAH